MSDATRPLVFVDVDGVVNAFGAGAWDTEYEVGDDPYHRFWVELHGTRFYISVPEYFPELFTELTEIAEVVWLTTWRNEANIFCDWIGIDRLPALDSPEGGIDWKWPAAEEMAKQAIAQGRLVIWVEDFENNWMKRAAEKVGVWAIDTAFTDYQWTESSMLAVLAECGSTPVSEEVSTT